MAHRLHRTGHLHEQLLAQARGQVVDGVEIGVRLEQLEECRARRQVVVLDCCFSGAFARGAKGDPDRSGERLLGQGRGRVVLTASRGTEYSFEGESSEGAEPGGSVFTGALVEGIRTGASDTDQDSVVLDPGGSAPVYLAVAACTVRLTDA